MGGWVGGSVGGWVLERFGTTVRKRGSTKLCHRHDFKISFKCISAARNGNNKRANNKKRITRAFTTHDNAAAHTSSGQTLLGVLPNQPHPHRRHNVSNPDFCSRNSQGYVSRISRHLCFPRVLACYVGPLPRNLAGWQGPCTARCGT